MLDIKGTSLITTDWHFGNKNDIRKYHKILVDVIRQMNRYAKNANIDNMIFCGDMFHKRNAISVDTMNIAIKCIDSVSKHFKNVYLILGNHDMFNQSNADIHSPLMFKNVKNVHIIDNDEDVMLNGKKCLFVPWFSDLTKYEKNSFDMIFGHFEISNKYMATCYKENLKNKKLSPEEIKMEIENDELLRDSGLTELDFENENTDETFVSNKKSSELLGSWIEIVKEGGTIFAGHIHRHKEFYAKGRKFIFIGSPYQTTRSETNSEDGFYVMKEDGTYTFERTEYPEHVDIKISDIVKNIDMYDFSALSGKIVHKVYDMEISKDKDAEIIKKINDIMPYDEVNPDYIITKREDGTEISSDTMEKIGKSPLEYLRCYVMDMDDSLFDGKHATKENVFEYLKNTYEKVGGEQ